MSLNASTALNELAEGRGSDSGAMVSFPSGRSTKASNFSNLSGLYFGAFLAAAKILATPNNLGSPTTSPFFQTK